MKIDKKSLGMGLLFLIALLAGYYFFILKPRLETPNKLLKAEEILSRQSSLLLQNRLSLTELTRLDENRAGFNLEKSELVSTLKKTKEEGLANIDKEGSIPEIDKSLTERFPSLLEETKKVYLDQEKLLDKVFETNSYTEGVKILKSNESVELITKETNLILEYQFFLNLINEKQENLNISE